MATMTTTTREPIVPTAQEAAIAREATRVLAPFVDHLENLKFEVGEGRKAPHKLLLPASAVRLLLDLLTEMAAGNAVTLILRSCSAYHPTDGGCPQCIQSFPCQLP